MTDDDQGPETFTSAEMAAKMGVTPAQFADMVAEANSGRIVVVPEVPGNGTWTAMCEACGPQGSGTRETATTEAHRHNDAAHNTSMTVRLFGS